MSHSSVIIVGNRLVESDRNALQHQVCKGTNENSAIKVIVLSWGGGLVDAKMPAAEARKWGAPPALVFVLQVVEDVGHVVVAIATTGIIILNHCLSKIHTNQCPVVSPDVHWNKRQSQVEEVSTGAVVPL